MWELIVGLFEGIFVLLFELFFLIIEYVFIDWLFGMFESNKKKHARYLRELKKEAWFRDLYDRHPAVFQENAEIRELFWRRSDRKHLIRDEMYREAFIEKVKQAAAEGMRGATFVK